MIPTFLHKRKISRIYVTTWKGDFHLAELCIASIRYWYPRVPVTLIKDANGGDFDCTGLLERWNVDLQPTKIRNFGTGFSKLEPLLEISRQKYLHLDADTLMLGPVLDRLDAADADFIVHPEGINDTSHIQVEHLLERTSPPVVMHWPGNKPAEINDFIRGDLLLFFEDYDRKRAGTG